MRVITNDRNYHSIVKSHFREDVEEKFNSTCEYYVSTCRQEKRRCT